MSDYLRAVLLVCGIVVVVGRASADEWDILDHQKAEHEGGVICLGFSPDGKTLVTATGKGIRAWDVSGKELKQKADLKDAKWPGPRSVAVFPDGKAFAFGTGGNQLFVFDFDGKAITHRLTRKDQEGNPQSVAFLPDGKTLASGSDDMTVLFYDVTAKEPKEKFRFKVQKANLGVKDLFFSPDGQSLILCTGSGDIRLFDVSTDKPVEKAKEKGRSVSFRLPIAVSPDFKTLAAGSAGTTTIWDVTADGFKKRSEQEGHDAKKGIGAIAFSPDGKYLGTADRDGRVIVWDAATGKPLLDKQLSGTFQSLAFVPEPAGADGSVRLAVANWSSGGTVHLLRVGKKK